MCHVNSPMPHEPLVSWGGVTFDDRWLHPPAMSPRRFSGAPVPGRPTMPRVVMVATRHGYSIRDRAPRFPPTAGRHVARRYSGR